MENVYFAFEWKPWLLMLAFDSLLHFPSGEAFPCFSYHVRQSFRSRCSVTYLYLMLASCLQVGNIFLSTTSVWCSTYIKYLLSGYMSLVPIYTPPYSSPFYRRLRRTFPGFQTEREKPELRRPSPTQLSLTR